MARLYGNMFFILQYTEQSVQYQQIKHWTYCLVTKSFTHFCACFVENVRPVLGFHCQNIFNAQLVSVSKKLEVFNTWPFRRFYSVYRVWLYGILNSIFKSTV